MYEKFEALLKERSVTAAQVAKATGIDPSTLSNWKHYRTHGYIPKVDKIKKIADYFGVPLTYFYEED